MALKPEPEEWIPAEKSGFDARAGHREALLLTKEFCDST